MPSHGIELLATTCRTFLVLGIVQAGALAGDRPVSGRVVDQEGRPVAGATVDDFWRANGPGRDAEGKAFDLSVEANVRRIWGHLGEMEPTREKPGLTDADGRFRLEIHGRSHALMALDRERRRGGLAILPKGRESEPVEIRLEPLIRVRGEIEGPGVGERPGWSHVYTLLPDDPTRPLDSTRLVSCGSFEARFEMALPPGRYLLNGYNEAFDGQLVPDARVDLTGDTPEVNLGVLRLSKVEVPSTSVERAKAEGNWIDRRQLFGKGAPRWGFKDARGVAKGAQPEDFRGKWVLIYFWGFHCAPCLGEGLPELMTVYRENEARRDRFEILAVCVDHDGDLASMADVDRRLAPIIENVWGGVALPFPVALDDRDSTWGRHGMETLGPALIDPEGRYVEGDAAALRAILEASDEP